MIQANMNELTEFIVNHATDTLEVKVTKIQQLNFSDMVGYNYSINIKLVTTENYKNKMVELLTNSTWLDFNESEDLTDGQDITIKTIKEGLTDYLNNLLI